MSGSPTGPRAAYFEEYNEDAKTTLPETRQTANIAAKRAKPDISNVKTAGTAHDEFSDSGYSSRTGATPGSGDSSLDSKTGAAPLKIDTSATTSKGRVDGSHQAPHHVPQTARKPTLRRMESKAQRGGCQCDECTPKQSQTTRSPEKARSSWDGAAKQTSKAQQQTAPPPRPQSTKPTSRAQQQMAAPPRPQSTKPLPPKPAQDIPTSQSVQARLRASSSQFNRKQRPMSFHAGSMPQVTYQPMYMHAPPTVATPSPFLPPSYPPPMHSYFPPTPPVQHQSYSYAMSPSPVEQRPPFRGWIPEQPSPQRQSLVYSTSPVVEHAQEPQYTTTIRPQPVLRRTSIPRGSPYPPREEHYMQDEDYYRMPPPPPPPPKQQTQRPAIRHAATTSVTQAALYSRHSTHADTDQSVLPLPRNPVNATTPTREAPRRPTLGARPSTSSSNNSASGANAIERDMRRLSIESKSAAAKQRRPLTCYGPESPRDLERSVEAYQASTGTGAAFPLTADSLNLVRKTTHTGSESGSRVSAQSKGSRGSSDAKARSLTDRKGGSDVKARNEADGITMHFNASQAVNVDMKGSSVDGRTISLRPSKDGGEGGMVFSIGGKSGTTSSRASLKDRSRRRSMYVEGSSSRELEPATSASRGTRESKTRESSRAPEKRVGASRSRRSSKSGRK